MNIYESRAYLVLTFIALALVGVSLLLLPGIKLGVEFRGGSLIISDLSSPIDVDSLQSAFLESGFAEVKALQYKTALGYRLEVEVPLSEDMATATAKLDELNSYLEEYTNAYVRGEESEAQASLEKAKKALSEIAEIASQEVEAETAAEISGAAEDLLAKMRADHESRLKEILAANGVSLFSIETVTPSLSTSFIEKVKSAALLAVVLAIIFVFLVFRDFVPSIAIITGALADIIIALGFMSYFGIPLSLASFAALLMLIGYSLDTDILLTTRVVKRRDGTKAQRAWDALKTGSTMTLTGLLSFTVLLIVSLLLRIPLYYQIASVAVAGLVGDLFATWGINAVMLLHFAGGKK